MSEVKPVAPGYKRQWYRCRKCQDVSYMDFIPYAISNPIRVPPCGHSFKEDLVAITEEEAVGGDRP